MPKNNANMPSKYLIARELGHEHARQLGHLRNVNDCPRGYAGDDCSIEVSECSAARFDLVHSCYYGSSCIDASNDFGLLDRYCECEMAGELTAGLMCQYQATSVCTVDEAEDQVADQFCVNGGVCVAFVRAGDSHPGCICDESWEGKHCEFAHGVLMDDALDLFQQRKTEIAIESSANRGDSTPMATNGDAGQKEGIPLFFAVGAFLAATAVIMLSMFATWKYISHQTQSKDKDYRSIGIGHMASKSNHASKPVNKSSLPPPADVFLASRKKDVTLGEEACFEITDSHEDDTEDVEMLDDETSRMIEAQFKSSELVGGEENHEFKSFNDEPEEKPVFASSYASDDEDIDQEERRLHSRITINSGKDPFSKLQNETLSDAMANGSVEDNKATGKDSTKGATSLDGEYDDDSDDDNYFV